MIILELNGRFPADADLDAAWQRGIAALKPHRDPEARVRLTPKQPIATPRRAP